SAPRHRDVLAVVGAGHLKGITALRVKAGAKVVEGDASPDDGGSGPGAAPAREALRARLRAPEATPPPSKANQIIHWAILVLVVAGFAVGFLRSPEEGLRLLTDWTIVTASLAGLGTLAALAHPLTILATAIAAPFTTLNPLLGAGFVAAG